MTREEAIEIIWDGMEIKRHPKDLTLTVAEVEEAKQMAIAALEQVTEVRKLILQAERSGVHLDYGAYKFMSALEKIVGEKQMGEFDDEDDYQKDMDEAWEQAKALERRTIQKPLKCRNANCVGMCSPADAEFWSNNPEKCPNYKRGSRQTGEWIKLYMSDTGENKYECSKCGFAASGEWKFCCECGADMRGAENAL